MATHYPQNLQNTSEFNTQVTPLQPTLDNYKNQSTATHSQLSSFQEVGRLTSDTSQYVTSTLSLIGGLSLMIGSLWLFVQTWNWFNKDKVGRLSPNSYMNAFKSIPCYNCMYFSDNLYIKCAVHPDSVLTQSAHHCPDHCPRAGQVS